MRMLNRIERQKKETLQRLMQIIDRSATTALLYKWTNRQTYMTNRSAIRKIVQLWEKK